VVDDTARIRADIEETREELGETARALAEELDPRTRARQAAGDAGDKARGALQRLTAAAREDPRPFAAVAAILVLALVRRRRR
jgi:MYXO-CTERM domain-containing protein